MSPSTRPPVVCDPAARFAEWLATVLPQADDVRIEGWEPVQFGHSAEMLSFTVAWRAGAVEHTERVVARLRPPPPGLLEPYDMQQQFHILTALEDTPVRAPRALWLEPTGDVLGREFYVMAHADGAVYERTLPAELIESPPTRIRRMCESMIEQIAAIHKVDLSATGLDSLGDGHGYLTGELDHWQGEMERVKRGRLPQLERLHDELRRRQPDQCPTITLVHGDPKPGNFAFVGDEVNAVFDWEMTAIGDPLADIGWMEMNWALASPLPKLPDAMSLDEAVAYWSELTGISTDHREWYRAFQGFKCIVIMLLGSMLFDSGATNDLRFAQMAPFIPPFSKRMLHELGVDDDIEPGPVAPREERLRKVEERQQR